MNEFSLKHNRAVSELSELHVRHVERVLATEKKRPFLRKNGKDLKGLCLFFGTAGRTSYTLSEWAADQALTLLIIDKKPLPLDCLQDCAEHVDFLIIDADYLDDTEQTVDFCMQIRRSMISLPIILLSSEMRGHDLTCENMMACDATLEVPLQKEKVSEAVETALTVNSYLHGG